MLKSIRVKSYSGRGWANAAAHTKTPSNPRTSQPPKRKGNLDQARTFWESYNKAADFEDQEFVKSLGLNLDALLTFAGLFAGVNTAFIIEAMKTIQPDNAELGGDLIRSVILVMQDPTLLQNATATEELLHKAPFVPKPRSVRSTSLFFISLCCSLTAAFGAVLAKQWLNYYERRGSLRSPPEQGRERQRKYEGRRQWGLEGIIETLPTLLQAALFVFLMALVDFLGQFNTTIRSIILGFALVPALFYLLSTTAATIYPDSPFQTRLSISTRVIAVKLGATLRKLRSHLLPRNKILHSLLTRLIKYTLIAVGLPLRVLIALVAFLLSLATFRSPKTAKEKAKNLLVDSRAPWVIPFQAWRKFIQDRQLSNKYDVLDLDCLIFYMQKASTLADYNAVLEALNILPLDLEIDRLDRIVVSLVETTSRFLLKPAWDPINYKIVWGTASLNFQQLLNFLHLLYVRWRYRPYLDNSIQIRHVFDYKIEHALRDEIWRVFEKDMANVKTVSLIADIMEARFCGERSQVIDPDVLLRLLEPQPTAANAADPAEPTNGDDPPESTLKAQAPFPSGSPSPMAIASAVNVPDPHVSAASHPLPYLKLLSAVLDSTRLQAIRKTTDHPIKQVLLSTMWVNKSPDLSYATGRLRVDLLPAYLVAKPDEHDFSKYLYSWGELYRDAATPTDSEDILKRYLKSLCVLLHSYPDSPHWPQDLEHAGHPSLLLEIIDHCSQPLHPSDQPDQHLAEIAQTTYYCYLMLWKHNNDAAASSQRSLYMHTAAAKILVRFWRGILHYDSTSSGRFGDLDLDVRGMLECTVAYMEQARLLVLLGVGELETVVQGYKQVGNSLRASEPLLLTRLYQRLDRLLK